jgi:hypothetical protein
MPARSQQQQQLGRRMLTFQLFRAKVTAPRQDDLFAVPTNPGTILRDALVSQPTVELRRGYVWHIGNVQQLDDDAYYFAVGRVTKRSVQFWVDAEQAFADVEFGVAPYTHAIADVRLELCALARKPELAPTSKGIANKLSVLLNTTDDMLRRRFTIDLAPIFDPKDFLESLRTAYAIKRFSATYGLPNPWDVEKEFQEPIERFTREVGGRKTKASVSGPNLDAGKLEEVTRSAAATGSDVQAKIQTTERARPITKSLRGDAYTFSAESVESTEEKKKVVADARNYYDYIRDRGSRER